MEQWQKKLLDMNSHLKLEKGRLISKEYGVKPNIKVKPNGKKTPKKAETLVKNVLAATKSKENNVDVNNGKSLQSRIDYEALYLALRDQIDSASKIYALLPKEYREKADSRVLDTFGK